MFYFKQSCLFSAKKLETNIIFQTPFCYCFKIHNSQIILFRHNIHTHTHTYTHSRATLGHPIVIFYCY